MGELLGAAFWSRHALNQTTLFLFRRHRVDRRAGLADALVQPTGRLASGAVATAARWTDLIDPPEDVLLSHLPRRVHPTALDLLRAPHVHDDEPRPRIESHGDYVFGVLLIAVAKPEEDRVYYQEIDFVLTPDRFVTVSKTPPDEEPFDPQPAKEACRPDEPIGMYLFRLIDEVAERYLDLIDDLNDEIDELEDHVDDWPASKVRRTSG